LNKSEKILLDSLKEKSEDTELLSSVKKSIDPIGRLRGKPGFKAEILISVSTIYTQGGVIIAPAALPAVLQVPQPAYIFGLTDFLGGFPTMEKIVPVSAPWAMNNFLTSKEIQSFNDGALNRYVIGDLYLDLLAVVGAVNYNCYITVHCANVAYGTFLHSFSSDLIVLNSIRYSVPVIQNYQLINPLNFGTQSLFGKLVLDSIDPRMYVTNQQFNQQIADIPVTLPIDKTLMMATYLAFDVQNISFLLTVQKVKPLTIR